MYLKFSAIQVWEPIFTVLYTWPSRSSVNSPYSQSSFEPSAVLQGGSPIRLELDLFEELDNALDEDELLEDDETLLEEDEAFLEEEDLDSFLLLDEDFLSVQSLQIEDDDSSISSESTALLQAVKNAKKVPAIRTAHFLENR